MLASVSGRPFELCVGDGQRIRCAVAFVPPHVPRTLHAEDCGGLVSLNLDPASDAHHRLLRHHGGDLRPLPARALVHLADRLDGALRGQLDTGESAALSEAIIAAVCPDGSAGDVPLDRRVTQVMQRIRAGVGMSLADLAQGACLSPSRLTHLFHEQSGLSIKHFMLWAKLRRGLTAFASGRALTEIALAVGFADLSHMSRTFQRVFGLQPSYLANGSEVRVWQDPHALQAWMLRRD